MTKEEAISIISGYEAYGCGYCLQGGEEVEEALRLAVDAMSVRHGRWIAHTMSEITGYDPALSGDDPVCSYSCSVCGEDCYVSDTGDDILSNYCPNCGADMREVEHETD